MRFSRLPIKVALPAGERKPIVAQEAAIHQFVCDYIRLQYPKAIFRTDFAAGIKMTLGQARKHRRMQSERAYPDIFVAEPCGGHHGLYMELKRAGTRVMLQNGQMTADAHIREQSEMLERLRARGYAAGFAIGFDQAKEIIDMYMRGERDIHRVAQCTFYDVDGLAKPKSTDLDKEKQPANAAVNHDIIVRL